MNFKQFKIRKLHCDLLYLCSFFVPALILLTIFIVQKIYPFGERSFLHIDMYHQYFLFWWNFTTN